MLKKLMANIKKRKKAVFIPGSTLIISFVTIIFFQNCGKTNFTSEGLSEFELQNNLLSENSSTLNPASEPTGKRAASPATSAADRLPASINPNSQSSSNGNERPSTAGVSNPVRSRNESAGASQNPSTEKAPVAQQEIINEQETFLYVSNEVGFVEQRMKLAENGFPPQEIFTSVFPMGPSNGSITYAYSKGIYLRIAGKVSSDSIEVCIHSYDSGTGRGAGGCKNQDQYVTKKLHKYGRTHTDGRQDFFTTLVNFEDGSFYPYGQYYLYVRYAGKTYDIKVNQSIIFHQRPKGNEVRYPACNFSGCYIMTLYDKQRHVQLTCRQEEAINSDGLGNWILYPFGTLASGREQDIKAYSKCYFRIINLTESEIYKLYYAPALKLECPSNAVKGTDVSCKLMARGTTEKFKVYVNDVLQPDIQISNPSKGGHGFYFSEVPPGNYKVQIKSGDLESNFAYIQVK